MLPPPRPYHHHRHRPKRFYGRRRHLPSQAGKQYALGREARETKIVEAYQKQSSTLCSLYYYYYSVSYVVHLSPVFGSLARSFTSHDAGPGCTHLSARRVLEYDFYGVLFFLLYCLRSDNSSPSPAESSGTSCHYADVNTRRGEEPD